MDTRSYGKRDEYLPLKNDNCTTLMGKLAFLGGGAALFSGWIYLGRTTQFTKKKVFLAELFNMLTIHASNATKGAFVGAVGGFAISKAKDIRDVNDPINYAIGGFAMGATGGLITGHHARGFKAAIVLGAICAAAAQRTFFKDPNVVSRKPITKTI